MQTEVTIKATLIFVFVFALYFFTRSPGLDELDSVQFAMGVGQFDLWRNQPHPPGYPLYIFFGWAAQMFCKWDPVFSLHMASCLGGALFVTTWFLICRTQFNETFGWWIASTLAVTPVLWLSATKPMTDALAAGLLGAQLLCSLRYRRSANDRYLILAALAGAAAAGVRPQFFAVVLVVLLVALFQVRARRRDWWIAITLLVAGCLVWLLPMSYLQWKLHREIPWWQVYPRLIWQQWNWRLEEPSVYIGAHNAWKLSYLTNRIYSHFAGWFILGLGLWRSTLTLVAGSLLVALGVATYLFRLREEDREFWKQNWAWATLHILIIFCSLPWEPRYYLPIFPLLLVPIRSDCCGCPASGKSRQVVCRYCFCASQYRWRSTITPEKLRPLGLRDICKIVMPLRKGPTYCLSLIIASDTFNGTRPGSRS